MRVSPGDVVFADIDGACVVPRAPEHVVFALALEKARREKSVRQAMEPGLGAKAAFEK